MKWSPWNPSSLRQISYPCFPFEVSLARRQNLKLAWEDAWNHAGMKLSVKWLSHGLSGHDAVIMTCSAQAENHVTMVTIVTG